MTHGNDRRAPQPPLGISLIGSLSPALHGGLTAHGLKRLHATLDNLTMRYQTGPVRDPYRLSRDRVWFLDDREPPRRLQVTNHAQGGLVVFSIWHEDVCTATFRLPVADAPALIELLVAGLADAARPALPAEERTQAKSGLLRLRDWSRRLLNRWAA
jgi:hypothetical protein